MRGAQKEPPRYVGPGVSKCLGGQGPGVSVWMLVCWHVLLMHFFSSDSSLSGWGPRPRLQLGVGTGATGVCGPSGILVHSRRSLSTGSRLQAVGSPGFAKRVLGRAVVFGLLCRGSGYVLQGLKAPQRQCVNPLFNPHLRTRFR